MRPRKSLFKPKARKKEVVAKDKEATIYIYDEISYFGVDATYAASGAVLRRILEQETQRQLRKAGGASTGVAVTVGRVEQDGEWALN